MGEKRQRNTIRQREAGAAARAETRRRLIEAAGEEFGEHGYPAARVSRIADRAGVSVQTLYLACGSKRELLRAHLSNVLYGGVPPGEYLASRVQPAASTDVPEQVARVVREIAERAGHAWLLYAGAAVVDPSVAEDWENLQTLRRDTFEVLLAPIPDEDLRVLRSDAVDTAWTIASPETYNLLVRRAGYSLDRYQTWIATTLKATLLK
jgi:AcrR family transcriptional regulator